MPTYGSQRATAPPSDVVPFHAKLSVNGIPGGVGVLGIFPGSVLPSLDATDVLGVPPAEKGFAMVAAEAATEPPWTAQPMPTQPRPCAAWLPVAARILTHARTSRIWVHR